MEATRALQVVFKRTGGLVWKIWPMNHTRRANAKKRTRRLHQVEAVLRACAGPPPSSADNNRPETVLELPAETTEQKS